MIPFNPFSPLAAKIFGGSTLLLALALGGTVIWGKVGWHQAASWKLAAAAQEQAVIAVQAAAAAKEQAQRIDHANTNSEVLASARAAAAATLAAGRVAAERYAAAHPVARPQRMCAQGAAGGPGRAAAAAVPDPAPVDDRAGDPAGLVALSRADFDLLTGAALRAASDQQTAQALIDAGLAMPEPDFGP